MARPLLSQDYSCLGEKHFYRTILFYAIPNWAFQNQTFK